MLHRGGANEKFFADFISANPQVGGHFKTKMRSCEDIIVDEDKEGEEELDTPEKDGEKSTMHCLGRKNLSSGFYGHELICELQERGKLGNACFGPKTDPQDENETVSYKASVMEFMREVEDARKEEIYKHPPEECFDGCRRRGCGQVTSLHCKQYTFALWNILGLEPARHFFPHIFFPIYPNS